MWRLACLAVALAACGADAGPGSVTGTIEGMTFDIQDAVSSQVMVGTGSDAVYGGAILLTSTGGACADVLAHQVHPNEMAILIAVTAEPNGPGVYSLPTMGSVSTTVLDPTCNEIAADHITSSTGTITISAVSGHQYTGSFDVTFDTGDHVTGSFDPEACSGLDSYLGGATAPACI